MECPCRNCDDRHVNCHASCSSYGEWKTKLNVINDQIKQARNTAYMCDKVHNEAVRRAKKKKRNQR